MDKALLAILTTKAMNEAYEEIRRTFPPSEWLKLSQEEKERLCTETIMGFFEAYKADELLAKTRERIN